SLTGYQGHHPCHELAKRREPAQLGRWPRTDAEPQRQLCLLARRQVYCVRARKRPAGTQTAANLGNCHRQANPQHRDRGQREGGRVTGRVVARWKDSGSRQPQDYYLGGCRPGKELATLPTEGRLSGGALHFSKDGKRLYTQGTLSPAVAEREVSTGKLL